MKKSQQSWVISQHLATQWNLTADEAVLKNVHKKEKKIPI
jgi:hypothetical protein